MSDKYGCVHYDGKEVVGLCGSCAGALKEKFDVLAEVLRVLAFVHNDRDVDFSRMAGNALLKAGIDPSRKPTTKGS
jgi:hypothetical protein